MECEGKSQRMIFHVSAVLAPKEQTALEGFRKYLEENRITLPAGFDDEDRLIQRFLEGSQWRFKEAYDSMMVYHRFTLTFPIKSTEY